MDLEKHDALNAAEIKHVKNITNSGKLYYDYDPLIAQARNHVFLFVVNLIKVFRRSQPEKSVYFMIFLVKCEKMLKLVKDLLKNLALIFILAITLLQVII